MKIRFVLLNCVFALALAACGGGGDSSNPTYTVTATISGLAGSGLVLLNNGGNNLAVASNGTATFTTTLSNATAYSVTVATQPSNPNQTCIPSNNTGTVNGANVTTIAVTCTTNTYTIGGTITGLSGTGMVLENNYGNDFAVSSNGNFTFTTSVPSNGAYFVTVATVPNNPVQQCAITNGSGTVTSAAITNVGISCSTQVPRFATSLNYYGGTLAEYNIDSTTGQPRIRNYVKLGQTPIGGVSDSTGTFTYMLNTGKAQPTQYGLPPVPATTASISAFRNNLVTGDRTEISGSPFLLTGSILDTLSRIAIHPNDKFLYVTDDGGANKIWSFAINPTTGALTTLPSISFDGTPSAVVFNPQGTYAYVTSRTSKLVYVYSVDTNTGAFTEISANRMATGANPIALIFHPNGKFAYVTNVDDATISVFAVDSSSGKLSAVPNSPFALGSTASPAIDPPAFHPNGKFIYVRSVGAPPAAGTISAFAINMTTGSLSPITGSPYAIGVNSFGYFSYGIYPTGKFLYVANRGSGPVAGVISGFSIDGATGVLTPLSNMPSVPANYAQVDPSGRFLYAASVDTDQIFSYTIDSTTGALTLMPRGGVIRSGAEPLHMLAWPGPTSIFKNKFAYVPNGASNTISNYSTDATTGALSAPASTVTGLSPKNVATSLGSKYAFATNAGDKTVSAYTMDATTGALSLVTATGGTQQTGANPISAAVDPTGRFVYVANNTDGTVSLYSVNASTGALTSNGTANTIINPLMIAVDPTGRNLFVMNTNQIQVLWINNVDGSLSNPPPLIFNGLKSLLNTGALRFAIDPRGKYLYVASSWAGGSIETYAINTYGGTLSTVPSLIAGRANVSIAVDPTGRFAFTADNTDKKVSAYTIDQSTGALTFIGSVDTPTPASANGTNVSTDYSGKFVYVALSDNTVATYSINQTTGALTLVPGGGSTTGNSPGPITTIGEVE